jgi:hypothetical protein
MVRTRQTDRDRIVSHPAENSRDQLPGEITIGRSSATNDSRPISIRLRDETSKLRVVEITLSLADFAAALTGLGFTPCKFTLNRDTRIGKRCEHKTEDVFIPKLQWFIAHVHTDPVVRDTLAPFEVDGWKGRVADVRRSHNRLDQPNPRTADGHEIDGFWCAVDFERWIDTETG